MPKPFYLRFIKFPVGITVKRNSFYGGESVRELENVRNSVLQIFDSDSWIQFIHEGLLSKLPLLFVRYSKTASDGRMSGRKI